MKHGALIVLPLLITVYFGLSQIWGWPGADKVMATLSLLNTILGGTAIAGAVSYNNSDVKYDGELHMGAPQDGRPASAQVVFDSTTKAMEASNLNTATLKVVNVPSPLV